MISVVVPVTNNRKFRGNVLGSPGLREIGAKIVAIREAKSAAGAFYAGVALTSDPWILYCHQDVYFPCGSGRTIEDILSSIPEPEVRSTIIGFAGLDVDGKTIGNVIDRGKPLGGNESSSAVSIDELAVILHRESRYRISPSLGWHLWATDLCLQSGGKARVACVPIQHNSSSGYAVPPEFRVSAGILLAKWPQHKTIRTLCATLNREGNHEVANSDCATAGVHP